jgi:NAD(P)-dependent dehydrogenase (short-subunit alcohol dehydrogenase family)
MELEGDLGLDSIRKVEILSLIAEETGGGQSQDQSLLARARTLGEWLDFFAPADEGAGPSSRAPLSPAQPPEAFSPAWPGDAPGPAGLPASPGAGKSLIQSALEASMRRREAQARERLLPEAPARPPSPPQGAGPAARDLPEADPGGPVPEAPVMFRIESAPFTPSAPEDGALLTPALLAGQGELADEIAQSLAASGIRVFRASWEGPLPEIADGPPRTLILSWPGMDRDPSLITRAMSLIGGLGENLRLLAGVSCLGGAFGFPRSSGAPSRGGNPASAALGGLVKSAAREYPRLRARMIDLTPAAHEMPQPGFADQLSQALLAPGPVEIGLPGRDVCETPVLVPFPVPELSRDFPLERGDAVVATGGGRGVTAAVLLELAARLPLRFIVLGRTPLGPPEPPWLASLASEREIVGALHDRAPSLSPRDLSERARLTLNARSIRATLAALESLGSEAEYLSGHFEDPASADAAARSVKARFGPVAGLVHGAGLTLDHAIQGKSPEDFARVYSTKATMAYSLLRGFQDEPLRLILFMSSSSARFGRRGQADYAAANEVLNKLAWEERLSRPDAAVLSPSFGPFDGGMVDGRLASLFRAEGVGLIGLRAGARALSRVIGLGPQGPCELVVLGPGTDPAALGAECGPAAASGGPAGKPPAAGGQGRGPE